jgi:EAL domain-containing protein (putative c-di-GMP-specific phosphodiesterase class I)/DNA-binding CsgD family transcriptional regulator
MRILIFDDDAAIGRLIVRIATMSGLDATAVPNAEAFAKCLDTDPPQVIVLDLQLGDTDGIEQLRILAAAEYAGSLILMSGFDARVLETASAFAASLGLKVEGIVEKPVRPDDLRRIFERLQSAGQALSIERLLAAIVDDELSLEFQPIVMRDPPELKKLEALARWDHPVLGRIPPAEFLPGAERDSVAIDALTEWVLGAAVEAYQVLAEVGIAVPIAVNISAQNLHDLEFPDRLAERLRNGGMPPAHLYLEITETAAFKDPARTMDILSRLRLKGIQLTIDDFGTGYSSLKVLRQLPFTEIKIDLSFVSDMTTSRDSRAIAKSILDLAAAMEMVCVAEGIENAETIELLEQLGVCCLQGHFIARPMPIEAVPGWLTNWKGRALVRKAPSSQSQHLETATQEGHGEVATQRVALAIEASGRSPVRLSPRQLEVMQLLSKGKSVKEIARDLELGIGTVKVHLSQAYSSLGARNRVEAVMRAGLHH